VFYRHLMKKEQGKKKQRSPQIKATVSSNLFQFVIYASMLCVFSYMLNGMLLDFHLLMADEELDMVQKSKSVELDEKKSKRDNDKLTVDNSDVTRKEVQAESVKAEEDTLDEPAAGEKSDRSRDEAVIEAQKQEETRPVSDK